MFGLVLHATVVLEEELAGLLQNAPALADGAEAQKQPKNTAVNQLKKIN